jgi:Tfp pilus assembly protein PilV
MKIDRRKKGFLLIEAMLATIFLVSGVVAIIPLISFSLREAIDSRDQVIAGMLAQEGAELVQNLRDDNWVQLPEKKAFESNFPLNSATNCRLDYNDSTVSTCDSSSKALSLNGNGFYSHDGGGTATKFQRKIELKFTPDNNMTATKLEVVSVVLWKAGNFPTDPISVTNCNTLSKCAFTKTTLTNWRP